MPSRNKVKLLSRFKSLLNDALGRNEALTQTPSPLTSYPDGNPAPLAEGASSHAPWVLIEVPSPGVAISTDIKPENWESLRGLMDTLGQAASISGLVPVKSVIEGLVELIGLYEDAAQGQKQFDDLRVQLECIFDELSHHLSSSPVMTSSMENICWSMQKEIDGVKARQAELNKRGSDKADDNACVVLECYRRLQDHLERLNRNANISTWHIVDQIATNHLLDKLTGSLWECYNSGKAASLKRGPCTEGTRTNVLAEMHLWATGRNTGNIYWMSGMAGTGKTTIAYSLCEHLDAETNRMLCASFFCSRSLPECRDVGRIIPSIAYQLARCSQPFRYALSKATEKDPIAHTRLPQLQFESLIMQPFSNQAVKDAFPTNMVVVIDALDECDDVKSTKQILDVLLTKSNGLPIKFVVSSRPEPAIRDQMEKNGTWVDARVVLHELDSGEVKADIKTYLTTGLAPVKPSEADINQLAEHAGVLFIYAATVVRYVGYDDFARGHARLKAILGASKQQSRAQTEEIDSLYGAILEAAVGDMKLEPTEREDIKVILDTVICAREPLTVATLSGLLQLNDVDRVQAAIRPLWSVLHVVGPSMTVTTLHASFPDYMLDPQRSGAWYCDAKTHHHLLARRCFDCIRLAKSRFNICQFESSYLFDKEVADLDARVQQYISSKLRYSCQYWSSHLDAVESSTAFELISPLSQFLTTHLLLWMEVRNLTNTFPATLGELTAAKRWAMRHGMSRDMVDFLSDAWRFASTFVSSPVSQSTPHLYISMLPLLPPSSPIREHYSRRFRGLVKVKGTAIARRKDEVLAQWKFELRVRCMAYSPDGTRLAIGGGHPFYSNVDRLYLLDAFSGALLLDLSQGNKTEVHSIAFSPDSTRLACGSEDGVVSVCDLTIGQTLLSPFKAHSQCVSSILYSHDGSYIASASYEDTLCKWDVLSADPVITPLVGHIDKVTCIAITSDDARLVSGSNLNSSAIRVWVIQRGKLVPELIILLSRSVSALALSPDDSYIASGSPDGIRVWDAQTGQMTLGPLRDRIGQFKSLSIPPDGATIASTSDIDGVQIWDAASGKIVSKLGSFSDETHTNQWATYSLDGTRIILIRGDGTIRLLDTQPATTGSGLLPGHTSLITSVDISPDGRQVVSGSSDHTLCVWDLTQGMLLVGPLRGHTREVNMVRYSTDGRRIVSCSWDSTIRQWDAQSGADYGVPIKVVSSGKSATYSRDGTLIVSVASNGGILVWESGSGHRVLGPITELNQSGGLLADFSPDGTKVIAGYNDGSISVWDLQNGQLVNRYQDHGKSTCLALSPDGLYQARSFSISKIRLTALRTGGQEPRVFAGHTGTINCVRFSSDSTRIVSGSYDKTVHICDVKTGQSLFGPLSGHLGLVGSVAFSPDGRAVVSSGDLAIRVWDIDPKAPSIQDRDTEFADWVLNDDGWVVSGETRRLFWVPSDLHTSLMSPRNTLLIHREGYMRLKFEDALIGEAWAGCFRGY